LSRLPPELATAIVAALVAVALAILAALYRRNRAAIRKLRGAAFAPAYGLFSTYRVTQSGVDYPELAGRYRDHDFRIDAIVDTLTFRKLPVLWLRVSLLAPAPGRSTLDILVRSQNVEFYSPSVDLPHRIEPLPGWPDGALVRTDDPDRLPDRRTIDRHIGYFATPQAKEMLITPKGIRLVYMLDQARRAEYLVLRQAEFESPQVSEPLLKDLMDRLIALHRDLAAARQAA
jgi:hypothetical protein